MKTKKLVIVILFGFIFISCEETGVSLEDVYRSLPDVEYFSKNYSVGGVSFSGSKMYFNPNNPRIGREDERIIKYKGSNLDTVYNGYLNSSLVIYAADTEIGDICSVYEQQGEVGQLVFVNGKLIDIEPFYSLVDFKIKENYFIFVLANQLHKKYVIYKP